MEDCHRQPVTGIQKADRHSIEYPFIPLKWLLAYTAIEVPKTMEKEVLQAEGYEYIPISSL